MVYDGQVLIPTLIGSLLSCIATACVLIAYVKYAAQQRSFRHALVLNLALAGKQPSLSGSARAHDRHRIHQHTEQLDIGYLGVDPS